MDVSEEDGNIVGVYSFEMWFECSFPIPSHSPVNSTFFTLLTFILWILTYLILCYWKWKQLYPGPNICFRCMTSLVMRLTMASQGSVGWISNSGQTNMLTKGDKLRRMRLMRGHTGWMLLVPTVYRNVPLYCRPRNCIGFSYSLTCRKLRRCNSQ
jgi:hypothetical protein